MKRIENYKRGGLLMITVLLCQTAFSQENFIPGYIIKLNKDSLSGLVDYRNWDKNPRTIEFKLTEQDTSISYNSLDIIEFGTKDEIYVSAIVQTETSTLKTADLKQDPSIYLKQDTTFLQTLFRGEKELYYFKTKSGKENFYIKTNSEFELLIYKKYLKLKEGQKFIYENKKFVGQLVLYLSNCTIIGDILQNTAYKKNSLTELFRFHNSCAGSSKFFGKKKEKIHFDFGVILGASLTSLKFKSDGFDYLTGAEYSASLNFSGGLFLEIIMPRNRKKWSYKNELLYSNYKVRGEYLLYNNENNYSLITTNFAYFYLKMNNLISYRYPIGSFSIFLNAGLSHGYALKETNSKKIETSLFTSNKVQEDLALSRTRKLEQGIIMGLGLTYKDLSFEIRGEGGNAMSEFIILNSTTRRLFFLLAYRF